MPVAPATREFKRAGGRPRRNRQAPTEEPVTRGDVARVLGVNMSTVRWLEQRSELHPQLGDGGIRLFDLHEVLALKARRIRVDRDRTVELRLAAFEMFRQGVDWRDVAIRLRHDPFRTQRLWKLYALDRRLEVENDTGR